MMKNHSLDSPPEEAAASTGNPTLQNNINDGASKVGAPSLLAATDDDPYSTLITPTKAVADQQHQQLLLLQQRKEKQLQQPQQNIGKNVHAPSSTQALSLAKVVEKNHKKNTTTAAKPASTIKWPPVSSTKSLPPLSGRVSNLLIAEDNSHAPSGDKLNTSVQDTIEFEVNQECEYIFIVMFVYLFGILIVFAKLFFVMTYHVSFFFNNINYRHLYWTCTLWSFGSGRLYRWYTASI